MDLFLGLQVGTEITGHVTPSPNPIAVCVHDVLFWSWGIADAGASDLLSQFTAVIAGQVRVLSFLIEAIVIEHNFSVWFIRIKFDYFLYKNLLFSGMLTTHELSLQAASNEEYFNMGCTAVTENVNWMAKAEIDIIMDVKYFCNADPLVLCPL